MKKTLTINLNKTVFNIDEDAYDLLRTYLSDVSNHLQTENEKDEIISDIEARIAELFIEKLGKTKNVVTLDDVNTIIDVMGKPSQFTDEDETENTSNKTTKSNDEKIFSDHKHYYRDMDNALLGGVCAGLSAYLGWDVTLVRILCVIFLFVTSFSLIPIYLVVWLIAPKAETTAQKMAMHGEIVNIETIKNKMNDAKSYLESDEFKDSATNVGNRTAHFFQSIFKVLLTLLSAIFTVIGVAIAGTLIFALIVFLFQPETITGIDPDMMKLMEGISSEKITLLIFSILFIIGCPIFALIYWSVRARSTDRANSNAPFWVALVLWFAGIFMLLSIGSETFKLFRNNIQTLENWDISYDDENPNWTTENRTFNAPFYSIDASGVVDVELTHQAERSFSISTVKEYLPKVKTEVKDGVLKIYSTDFLIKPQVKIKIGIDSLTSINSQGATKVHFTNPFPSKNMKIELSGASSGYYHFLQAENIDLHLSGASKLEIEGATKTLKLEANGASHADCNNFNATAANVDVSGASSVDVLVTESFDGDASGASNIHCKGNPQKRTVDTSGSSNINFENE